MVEPDSPSRALDKAVHILARPNRGDQGRDASSAILQGCSRLAAHHSDAGSEVQPDRGDAVGRPTGARTALFLPAVGVQTLFGQQAGAAEGAVGQARAGAFSSHS